ncbi:hypothetical protein P3538_23660, partial [Vibrio parahaemolyticus]|nr:hypothetical protein [Vibrio parahaemolyticus]MDF4701614.1 hypothetical protein [Vibrio parahaemolyticus]
ISLVQLKWVKIALNKAFKRDSQRLAVLVQSLAFVIMAQWFASGGGVVHPLTRRYVYRGKNEDK